MYEVQEERHDYSRSLFHNTFTKFDNDFLIFNSIFFIFLKCIDCLDFNIYQILYALVKPYFFL